MRALDAISGALSARLEMYLTWNGEGLDRLLDADHAAVAEEVARTLSSLDWLVKIEASFNIRGERGSIDLLAFHPATGAVLVVEVKSLVPDVQAMLFAFDRKSRLALEIARDLGWIGCNVGRLLVIRSSRTGRRRIEAHSEIFRSAAPARNVAVKQWLRSPDPAQPFSGLWFVSDDRPLSARHRVGRRDARSRA